MKVLLIGGTGFIGQYLARDLVNAGHDVAVFHRGQSTNRLPHGVREIIGDRSQIGWKRMDFLRFLPDVVVDLILSSERQAQGLLDVFRGITRRLVVLSSQDVYRAYGVLLGIEGGPPQAVPLTEDSELRTALNPFKSEHLARMRSIFPWMDETYEKILVERAVMSDEKLPATVLRLPMVYGPGDPLHRNFPVVKRMDDGRSAIILQREMAGWRPPRGYVENVAAAIELAATSPGASGRIYNVAEREPFTEGEWVRKIGDVVGWTGQVVALAAEETPAHLRAGFNVAQDWIASSERIRSELGYQEKIDTDEALSRTIEWERANPPAGLDAAQFDYAAEDAALARFQPEGAKGPL